MPNDFAVHCVRPRNVAGTSLQTAILLTVHYRDLFSHALTIEELRRFLMLFPAGKAAIDHALDAVLDTHLSRRGDYITWQGRENIIEERSRRLNASTRLWIKARKYVEHIRRIPFVRMAGVSGSLAINHARQGSDDIDLFCIAQPNRVWVVMLYLKLLAAYSWRIDPGAVLCPNTCLAEDQLEITAQNLYMAHQIVQVVPLFGEDVYRDFLSRNAWVARFLPNTYAERTSAMRPHGAIPQHWSERLIPNRVGDGLNHCICRAGVRKAARFYRQTHTDAMLREARNPQRYMLPGNGYTGAIFRRFMDGHPMRFQGILSRTDMEAAFGCGNNVFFDARLDHLFRSRYEDRD